MFCYDDLENRFDDPSDTGKIVNYNEHIKLITTSFLPRMERAQHASYHHLTRTRFHFIHI